MDTGGNTTILFLDLFLLRRRSFSSDWDLEAQENELLNSWGQKNFKIWVEQDLRVVDVLKSLEIKNLPSSHHFFPQFQIFTLYLRRFDFLTSNTPHIILIPSSSPPHPLLNFPVFQLQSPASDQEPRDQDSIGSESIIQRPSSAKTLPISSSGFGSRKDSSPKLEAPISN